MKIVAKNTLILGFSSLFSKHFLLKFGRFFQYRVNKRHLSHLPFRIIDKLNLSSLEILINLIIINLFELSVNLYVFLLLKFLIFLVTSSLKFSQLKNFQRISYLLFQKLLHHMNSWYFLIDILYFYPYDWFPICGPPFFLIDRLSLLNEILAFSN